MSLRVREKEEEKRFLQKLVLTTQRQRILIVSQRRIGLQSTSTMTVTTMMMILRDMNKEFYDV